MSRRSGGARDAPAVRLLHGLAQRQTLRAEEITGLAFADLSDNSELRSSCSGSSDGTRGKDMAGVTYEYALPLVRA